MFRLPKTKFLPPQPHQKRMHRPQLEQCLRDLLPQSRIILICAPAGFLPAWVKLWEKLIPASATN